MDGRALARPLTGLDTTQLSAYLANCAEPFQPSQLYSPVEDEKKVDFSIRVSEFRALTDPKLFEIAEGLVAQVASRDPSCDWTLVRNDVTHIRYHPRGFFKRHQDYLSLTSNLVQEYTLLVCVTPPELAAETKGGETIVHFGDGGAVAHAETCVPGGGLLLRKDVEHEGALVEAGQKHVVSLNLWAVRRRSAQILLVSFPLEAEAAVVSAPATPSSGAATLLEEANARKYALSVSDVGAGSMLATVVEWANRAAEEAGQPPPPVVKYDAPCSFDEFGSVFRICCSMHLGAHELRENRHVIDYFFPALRLEDLLVDFAAQSSASEAPEVALATSAKAAAEASRETDTEVICCESEARTTSVLELARQLDLPYVRFKIIFVEGIIVFNFGGDCSKKRVPVLPAWVSLGDYDNIFVYRKLAFKGNITPVPLERLHRGCNVFAAWPEELRKAAAQLPPHQLTKLIGRACESIWDFHGKVQERNGETQAGDLEGSVALGLRVALPPREAAQRITELLFQEHTHIHTLDVCHLPDGLGEHYTAEWQVLVQGHNDEGKEERGGRGSSAGEVETVWAAYGDKAQAALEDAYTAHSSSFRGGGVSFSLSPGDEAWSSALAEAEAEAQAANAKAAATLAAGERRHGMVIRAALAGIFSNAFAPESPPFSPDKLDWTTAELRSGVLKRVVELIESKVGEGCKYSRDFGAAWLSAQRDSLVKSFRSLLKAKGHENIGWGGQIPTEDMAGAAKAAAAAFVKEEAVLPAAEGGGSAGGAKAEGKDGSGSGGGDEPAGACGGVACIVRIRSGCEFDGRKGAWEVLVADQTLAERAVRRVIRPQPPPQRSNKKQTQAAGGGSGGKPTHQQHGGGKPQRHFHRDAHGKTCFSEAEAERASAHVKELALDERVKACLQRKAFVLPQQSHYVNAHFCNESVYGTASAPRRLNRALLPRSYLASNNLLKSKRWPCVILLAGQPAICHRPRAHGGHLRTRGGGRGRSF